LLLLPTVSSYEFEGVFLNFEGRPQKTASFIVGTLLKKCIPKSVLSFAMLGLFYFIGREKLVDSILFYSGKTHLEFVYEVLEEGIKFDNNSVDFDI